MVSRAIALAGTVLLPSCGPLGPRPGEADPASGIGNAIVIDDESLDSSRGSVVSILRDHVRGMTVSRADPCPHIVVRGGSGRSRAAEALVYVDGQRIGDTCILDALDVDAISRVEVYPSGVTQRPGYQSNSGGLILVFMKSGPGRGGAGAPGWPGAPGFPG